MLLWTHSFTQRLLCTHCVQALLHRDILTHNGRRVYMQILYTAMFILHMFSFYVYTRVLCHRDAFNHTCFCTEMFLHRDAFTQRYFCTGMLSRTEMFFYTYFYREMILREQFYTQMPKQAEVLLQRNVLARGVFTYGHFYTLLNDFRRWTCIWHKRIQQTYAKSHFHHSF